MKYKLLKYVLLLTICISQFGCTEKVNKEIILLPDHFKGNAIIIYNQPNGIPDSIVNGVVIYKFPKNGILLCKGEQYIPNQMNNEYYYYNDKGLKKLPRYDDVKNDNNNSFIHNHQAGSYQKNDQTENFTFVAIGVGGNSWNEDFESYKIPDLIKKFKEGK